VSAEHLAVVVALPAERASCENSRCLELHTEFSSFAAVPATQHFAAKDSATIAYMEIEPAAEQFIGLIRRNATKGALARRRDMPDKSLNRTQLTTEQHS